MTGTACNGLMMSSIGRLLSEKLDVLRLTFYTAPLTLCVLVPFFNKLEAPGYYQYAASGTAGGAYIGEKAGCRRGVALCVCALGRGGGGSCPWKTGGSLCREKGPCNCLCLLSSLPAQPAVSTLHDKCCLIRIPPARARSRDPAGLPERPAVQPDPLPGD